MKVKNSVLSADRSQLQMVREMFLRMFRPSLVTSVTLALANIADALVVGNRVGETGLATIGLVTPVYLVYNLLGLGFVSGGAITHSQLTAAENRSRALAHFRMLSALLLGIGTAIAVLGIVFLEALLTGLGAGTDNPALREMCAHYLRPLVTAAPLFFLNFLLYYFVRNDDNPVLAAIGFSVSSILDLVLNIVFVLILDKGVAGAIQATLIAQTVSVCILCTHLFSSRKGILRLKAVLTARDDRREVRRCVRSSIRTGFSSSMSYLFQFLFLLISNHLLISAGMRGKIPGELSVAVLDLVLNCSFVMVSVYQASAEAMSPLAATLAVEHDEPALKYLGRLVSVSALIPGLVLAGILAVFARPVVTVFGLGNPEALDVAVPALRVYLASTPMAGMLTILVSFDQSTCRVRSAALETFLRNAVILLVHTVIIGYFLPQDFWWVFLLSEAGSLIVLLPLHAFIDRKSRRGATPVLSRTITNDNKELGGILSAVEEFCDVHEIPPATAMQLQLAVEELCAVTMLQAFSGKPGEYIRITLTVEKGPRYILHIRNSAPYFNPLDMKMDRARKDMEADIMDSIGVMMVQKKAKSMNYRNYQGYNVLTVEY